MEGEKIEKPKNLKKSLLDLLVYCKKHLFIICVAFVLAFLSSILTLVGPNKISEMTSIISKGLAGSYSLSVEQMDNLLIGEQVILDVDTSDDANIEQISLQIEQDEVLLTITISGVSSTFNADIIEGLEGTSNFSSNNFVLTKEDGIYSVWFNTNAQIDLEKIANIGFVLLFVYGLSLILGYLQNYLMAIVTSKIGYKMRDDISQKINRLPLKYLDSTQYGDILSRVTNDADTVAFSFSDCGTTLVSSTVLLLGSLIMMFITQPIMALSAVLSTIVGFVLMALIMGKSQKYFEAQQQNLGELNGKIEEIYSGHDIIRAYNANDFFKQKFSKANYDLYTSSWKSGFLGGLTQPLMHFIGNLGFVVVCVVGAILTLKGIIGFGVIVAFMIYIKLFTRPFSQIAQAFSRLQSTAAASERVFELLNQTELSNEDNLNGSIKSIKGNIEFKNVSFGYNTDKIIIKDFSAKIKAGQKIALVGPTGAGKTTMVNLLMKFYEINSGDILIDGVSIHNITRDKIHQMFGMVLQDTWLFEASIYDNLRYNNPNITNEQIIDACKTCGVHHFIKTLPNGYDTILDNNTSISAGQKQLLTITRAMLQNCPMLILDEATSSVDTRTEILIQNAMDTLTKNRTSFVIAHRLSTIKNADLILVLKNGDIVEKGTHKELLSQNGFYAELYKSQFEE